MVRELIRREFGVALSAVSVVRLLAKLGLSPQRPLRRAHQQDPQAVERWRREQFPAIVRTTGARHSVNLISAVTVSGTLRFAATEGRFASATFIDFCKRLLHDTDGPVVLVVDGHPTHRSRTVKEFVASTEGRLRLFHLPGYSPELNPDEWIWKNVKADRIGRAGVAPLSSRSGLVATTRPGPPNSAQSGGL